MGHEAQDWGQYLGAPAEMAGWRHGVAGSTRDDRRVDCWLAIDDHRVQSARFEVFAGPDALRGALWTARWVSDRSLADLESLTGLEIVRRAGLADGAKTDALCIEDAMRAAAAALPLTGGREQS